jgi:hypothetical protein
MYRWTRLCNGTVGRVIERIYFLFQTPTTKRFVANYSGKAEPQCQATPIEFGSPHEAICSGFVDTC